MSSYKVFKHPEKGFEAVKSGFAWLAPFNPVWPLFRGLWMLFISYIFCHSYNQLQYRLLQIYGLVEGYIDIANADDNLELIFLTIQIIIFISPGFQRQ